MSYSEKRYEEIWEHGKIIGTKDNKNHVSMNIKTMIRELNSQDERIKELKTDVEYWKQVASQYINELNVFEHCKKYKTECKDIYWDSD